MPQRETRESIERALAEQRRKRQRRGDDARAAKIARIEAELTKMRDRMDPAQFVRVMQRFHEQVGKIGIEVRRRRRRPDDGGMPALVEPPRGPKPFAGGAAAPLEFD